MSAEIVVHGFETSNNMKVRVALNYKSVPFEFRTIDPKDREELLRISGQHLTPVLVHGDRVVVDSGAILRYIEYTFRDGPRLFGSTHGEQWDIEDHELFCRWELAGPMMRYVHALKQGRNPSEEDREQCGRDFEAAAEKLRDALGEREWLIGDAMTAADITGACVFHRVRLAEMFEPGPATRALGPWVDRVVRYL